MNYEKIYERLINRAKIRVLIGYSEKHHIIPRCMGGSNSKENLVTLTPEEHYLAHQLLVKMFPNKLSLVFAATMMTKSANGKRINNKSFGWLKRKEALCSSVMNTGNKHGVGKKQSEETKKKLSSAMKGRKPWNVGIPNPKSAENARNGSNKMKNTIKGRKMKTMDDGRRVWEYPNGKTSS